RALTEAAVVSDEPTLYNLIARKFLVNRISVVMLTFNRSEQTIGCIRSFLPALADRSDLVELLILDNHSWEPVLLEFLAELSDVSEKIRVIFGTENLGVSGGRAILFEEAVGEII